MEKILTVKDLIIQLKNVDENLPVFISGVGLTSADSWDVPLTLEDLTVDVHDGKCRINMSTIG